MKLVNQSIGAFSLRTMSINATLEKNFSWLGFPGLIRAILMIQAAVFAVLLVKPEAAKYFVILPADLAEGHYWKLISWVFYPIVSPSSGMGGLINVLFMYFVVRIGFLINDALEHAWGEVRTSCYVYGIILCQAILYGLLPLIGLATGVFELEVVPFFGDPTYMFYLGLFFAFATVMPHIEFSLMLVLPVKVWILAIIAALGLLFSAVDQAAGDSFLLIFSLAMLNFVISFAPYLFWALPRFFRWFKTRGQLQKRRMKFQAHTAQNHSFSLHRCIICQRTEKTDPELDFRVAENGEEYCLDHLDQDPKASQP